MNDNNGLLSSRSDPFGMGLAAHRDHFAREACPYPFTHVEGRRWLAGWDHASFRRGDQDGTVDGRIERQARTARERPWSRGELVVLATLVKSGESVRGLSARLGRTADAIRARCAAEALDLKEGRAEP